MTVIEGHSYHLVTIMTEPLKPMTLPLRRGLTAGLATLTALFVALPAFAQDRPAVTPPTNTAPAPTAAPAQEPVVVTEEETPGTSVRAGRSVTVIHAPMEQVVRAMTDFTHYNEFMPHVRESRVIRRNRGATDVYLQVPLGNAVGVIWALLRINAQRTPDRLELVGQAVDSNMDRCETHTIIERIPGDAPATRLTFRVLALPRLPFPSSVFTREMRDAARTVATNVRGRVERMAALDAVRQTVPAAPAQTPANATSQR